MAFPWDYMQERWLERRFAGKAKRFESKVQGLAALWRKKPLKKSWLIFVL